MLQVVPGALSEIYGSEMDLVAQDTEIVGQLLADNQRRDARIRIDLIDENDNIPEFVNTDIINGQYNIDVSETTAVGDFIIRVSAIDEDATAQFNQVRYCLESDIYM